MRSRSNRRSRRGRGLPLNGCWPWVPRGNARRLEMPADNIIECKGALILGAGIAGLFTALKLAPFPATVIAGARPGYSGSSAWAQGGIAAAVGKSDSWQAHARDTIAAGAGACDPKVVEIVTREAAAPIEDLVA